FQNRFRRPTPASRFVRKTSTDFRCMVTHPLGVFPLRIAGTTKVQTIGFRSRSQSTQFGYGELDLPVSGAIFASTKPRHHLNPLVEYRELSSIGGSTTEACLPDLSAPRIT